MSKYMKIYEKNRFFMKKCRNNEKNEANINSWRFEAHANFKHTHRKLAESAT